MSAAVVARIDLAALRHNFDRVKLAAPNSRVMAVVKANGYGHGMVQVAQALAAADAFAVARLDEALSLRQAGIDKPIAVLEGFNSVTELALYAEHTLQPVVHQVHQVELLAAFDQESKLDAWLKVDTGMHRMGVAPKHVSQCCQRLQQAKAVNQLRLLTHFSCADDRQDQRTQTQIDCFTQAKVDQDCETSLANSAAILAWPESHADWVRPGLMLFGVSPFIGGHAADEDLKPVMSLSSRLIAVNRFHKGDAIGYGASWACPEAMPVGVVACGYGDGYPRHAQAGTPVLVNGRLAPLVGRVSMDSICVDLRQQPDAKVGDPVQLWGDGLPVEDVARQATTIAYELLCSVTGRVDFQYS